MCRSKREEQKTDAWSAKKKIRVREKVKLKINVKKWNQIPC